MILGITGTVGAGKGTVVEHLKEKGFTHFAARDFIEEEVQKRNLPPTRESLITVANDLRAAHGPAYIIETLYERAKDTAGDVVIESVRTPAEARFLKQQGAILLSIDADQRVRYDRIVARGSETDHIDFDTFADEEAREMQNDDPNKQNIGAVMAMADQRISSDHGIEQLLADADAFLVLFKK